MVYLGAGGLGISVGGIMNPISLTMLSKFLPKSLKNCLMRTQALSEVETLG